MPYLCPPLDVQSTKELPIENLKVYAVCSFTSCGCSRCSSGLSESRLSIKWKSQHAPKFAAPLFTSFCWCSLSLILSEEAEYSCLLIQYTWSTVKRQEIFIVNKNTLRNKNISLKNQCQLFGSAGQPQHIYGQCLYRRYMYSDDTAHFSRRTDKAILRVGPSGQPRD